MAKRQLMARTLRRRGRTRLLMTPTRLRKAPTRLRKAHTRRRRQGIQAMRRRLLGTRPLTDNRRGILRLAIQLHRMVSGNY
jgi:hypothetical protein